MKKQSKLTENLLQRVVAQSQARGIALISKTERSAAVGCDRMCNDCTRTCTRDWGHQGPHRCDFHAR